MNVRRPVPLLLAPHSTAEPLGEVEGVTVSISPPDTLTLPPPPPTVFLFTSVQSAECAVMVLFSACGSHQGRGPFTRVSNLKREREQRHKYKIKGNKKKMGAG